MGEVVEVANGYARNFLIPGGIAVGVTRGTMKDIAEQKKVLEIKAVRQREQLQSVADKISSRPLVIKMRCSASGRLFGSITNRQLATRIQEVTGEEVERHNIYIDDRIRSVGVYKAVIKLHHDVEIEKEFEVEGEGFVAEEPPEDGVGSVPIEASVAAQEAAPALSEDTAAFDAVESQPSGEEDSGLFAIDAGEVAALESPHSERG